LALQEPRLTQEISAQPNRTLPGCATQASSAGASATRCTRLCFDNALVDTFFKILKAELAWRTIFQSRIEAASAIGRYTGGFYNPVRRHSALDFISALQFEGRAA
jgi:transposase InsO family protein